MAKASCIASALAGMCVVRTGSPMPADQACSCVGSGADDQPQPRLYRPRSYRALNRLRARRRLFVVLGVVLGGLVPMMGRMQSVRVRDVGVMPGLLMIAGFIVLGRFAMMMGGALVVIRGGLVVLATLVRLRAHVAVLSFGCTDGDETATEV